MMRTLSRELQQYNEDERDELLEETGWKYVHADVLRPPERPLLLCTSLGSGLQLIGAVVISIVLSMLGFLSPAHRGWLISAAIVLFALMGGFGGYCSAFTYKECQGTKLYLLICMTAGFWPLVVFAAFAALNLVLWIKGSSGAVPFGTFFALFVLWLCICAPLVLVGSFFAFKSEALSAPVFTNAIPRQIPARSWWEHPVWSQLLGGLLPFGAVYIELFFIMSSVWLQRFYYVFGFLTLVAVILVVVCAEMSIVLCYFQLCQEDYRWWWRSFLNTGATGIYLLLYSVVYYYKELDLIGMVPTLLYFGYMLIASLMLWLITGTIGFYASYTFIWRLYGAVKVD